MQALVLNITTGTWLRAKACRTLLGRGAYWGPMGCLKLKELPPPKLPGRGWVRCRTRLGGICGTDLAVVQLRQPPDSMLQAFSSMPLIPGHEIVAEVVEVHPSVDAGWVGRRACIEPTLNCIPRGITPVCPRCANGQFGVCENFGAAGAGDYALPAGTSIGYNSRTGGAWGEHFVAHVSQLIPIPDGLTDQQAILTDPLACGLHSVLRTDLRSVERMAVYGGGILGLGIVAAVRAVGFTGQIDLFARYPFQRNLAEQQGATNTLTPSAATDFRSLAKRLGGKVLRYRFGRQVFIGGYDAVYDCVGTAESLSVACHLARGRGQVILIGTGGGRRIDLTPVWFRELTVIGAYGRQLEQWQDRQIGTYQLVHELILSGKIDTTGLLTHTFTLPEYRQAFQAATRKARSECVKAAFRFL